MPWQIWRVWTGKEKQAAEQVRVSVKALQAEGKVRQVVLPTIVEKRRRKNGQQVIVERPKFPGYLLVEADEDDEVFRAIKGSPLVFFRLSGEEIPDSEIEHAISQQTSIDLFKIGDTVNIKDGAFKGVTGRVVDKRDDKLVVEIKILGRPTNVEIDYDQVEAC